jgi:hypothetical protein
MPQNELWVPIVLFLSIATVLGLWFYFRYRARREVQETVRAAIERGQELTPEFLERLGEPGDARQSDLRRGVIAAGIGAGFIAFALILGEEDAVRPLMAIGMFPVMIGLAYLGLWRFVDRDGRE